MMNLPWQRRQRQPSAEEPTAASHATMTIGTNDAPFSHAVKGVGVAQGMTLTGRQRLLTGGPVSRDVPLIIALHGGTYSSTYFDIPGYSLLDRAATAGIPIIALDRPCYGGSTSLAPEDATIAKNAAVLDEVIGEIWTAWGTGRAGIVLIGHSIGGAIVTAIAANHPTWPLLGMAISGCLLKVPTDSRDQWSALPDIPMIDLPVGLKDQVMFGPPETYGAGMPVRSHPANTPVPRAELIDITTTWIARVRATAAQVQVPVYSRQGEFDHLWITDTQQVSEFGAAFTASSWVDAQLIPFTGHCIDFHRQGAGFQLGQLGFALQCSVTMA